MATTHSGLYHKMINTLYQSFMTLSQQNIHRRQLEYQRYIPLDNTYWRITHINIRS
jgi:hypothetical protein